MKKFNNPMASGFAPYIWDDGLLPVLEDIYAIVDNLFYDAEMETAHGVGDGIIITGGVVSLNGGGPNIDITAGIAYLTKEGKFVRFPAATNVADPYYGVLASAAIQETFKDSVARDYLVNETLSLSASTPGDDDYIVFSDTATSNTKRLKDLLHRVLTPTWKSGSLVLGDFGSGVSAVSSADYQYMKMGDILYFSFDFNITTTATTIRFTLPDSMEHTGFDDDVFHHNGIGLSQRVYARNDSGQTELVVQKDGGGNVEQFTVGIWIGKIKI